jgi:hypothetical protein
MIFMAALLPGYLISGGLEELRHLTQSISRMGLKRKENMKPIVFGKNEKDATYCELNCSGFEKHTGRCIGWALFGKDYPGGESEEAFKKCPNNERKSLTNYFLV